MEKRNDLAFFIPLSPLHASTERLSSLPMERMDGRMSIRSSNGDNSSNWILGFDTFSINDRTRDTSQMRPLTESSVMPRPQWYEELLKQRRREETIVESNLEQTATRSDKNDMRTMNAKKDSPDIIMLLDENYEPRKGAKSGRRASSFIPAPDFFDSNTKISSKSDELKLPIDDFLILTKERKSVLFEKESTAKRSSLCAKDLELVDVDESECADFFIPEMPEGQQMIIELRSNWGDDDFIGLNGIEIFDAKTANVAKIEKAFCETDPQSDVSVLFDGVYRTHDNSHIWLQTFTPPASIKIKIKFSERITVLLLRVWNYNKSRIYSERGVRQMLITLDDKLIFKGEIAKAYGELKGPPERFGDTILYTTNETLLEAVAINDLSFKELLSESCL